MIMIPAYDLLVLPGTRIYFKKEYFRELAQKEPEQGDDIIFILLKQQKERREITEEDIYPVGVTGIVEDVEREDAIGVRTISRITLNQVDVPGNRVQFVERADIEDISAQEIDKRFQEMRNAILKFSNQFQWGIIARQYILNWKSVFEMASSLSAQLNLSTEEKYKILEEDVISQRIAMIEKALYEMIEVSKINGEAEQALTKSHELIYREEALKRQIEFLQKQLDDMHPENVSDVRRFEQKIQSGGMNETAKKEAEKVLNRMKQEGQNGHEYGLLYDYLDFTRINTNHGFAQIF